MLNKFIWNILLIFTFSNSAFYFVIFNSSGHFFHLTLPIIFIFIFRNILSAYFLFYISYFQNPWSLKKKKKTLIFLIVLTFTTFLKILWFEMWIHVLDLFYMTMAWGILFLQITLEELYLLWLLSLCSYECNKFRLQTHMKL